LIEFQMKPIEGGVNMHSNIKYSSFKMV